jgi:hypothetical protein
METEPTGQRTRLDPVLEKRWRAAFWGRALAVATAVVFVISSAFPIVAGFVTDAESWPTWWGVLDVTIAFVLAVLTFAVTAIASGKSDRNAEELSYRVYRVLIHGILAVLVIFFLIGDRVVWSNCLTGFAWRFWLLLYCLPAWLTVSGVTRDSIRGISP